MATPNYDFTTISGTGKINIANDVNTPLNQIDTALKEVADQTAASLAAKAPTNHASPNTTYGAGNATNYGHVRIVDSGDTAASGGVAASPKLVNDKITAALGGVEKTHFVVFGDSWSDESVEQAVWVPRFAEISGLTKHNYAINGGSFAKGSYTTEFNNFKADEFDKSKIACVIFLFGVNEYTDSTNASAVAANIDSLCDQVKTQTDAPIYHFFNYRYSDDTGTFSIFNTVKFWKNVMDSVEANNWHPVFMHSWFEVSDWVSANYFHLTTACQSNFLPRNIYATIFGGQVIEKPTYVFDPDWHGLQVLFDVHETSIEIGGFIVSGSTKESKTFSLVKPLPFPFSIMDFATMTTTADGAKVFAIQSTPSNQSLTVAVEQYVASGRIIPFHFTQQLGCTNILTS